MTFLHTWECASCGEFIQSIGPAGLLLYINDHQFQKHGAANRQAFDMERMLASPRYQKPAGASVYDAAPLASHRRDESVIPGLPTPEEFRWLEAQKISWLGDNRTTLEVSRRLKPKA